MATTLELLGGRNSGPGPQTLYKIVVGMDFSREAMRAADLAVRIAARHEGAELHLVGVAEKGLSGKPIVPYECVETALASLAERLAEAKGRRRRSFAILPHALVTRPADGIVGVARGIGADLIVLGDGTTSRYARIFFGSVTEDVKRNATCPVLTFSPPTLTPARPVRPPRAAAIGL